VLALVVVVAFVGTRGKAELRLLVTASG
jgi:hypothetical protein